MRVGALVLALALACSGPAWSITLQSSDRLLVLAPHPDDEAIGCAGLIQSARAAGAAVRVVFLTHGDANELAFLVSERRPSLGPADAQRMGETRRREALGAAQALGLPDEDVVFLGYPDAGTLELWRRRWGTEPLRSLLTRATAVPYASALHPGAPYLATSVLADLESVVRAMRPTLVAVSHPADANPDHQGLYLFTRVALWTVMPDVEPRLLPYLVHYRKWPRPLGVHRELGLDPPAPLDARVGWESLPLGPDAVAVKARAIAAHATQMRYGGDFLSAFLRRNELFGDFPPVPADGHPVRLDGDDLVFTAPLARPIDQAIGHTVELFPYRADRPFATMPKLRIEVGPLRHEVFDQDRRIPSDAVAVRRSPSAIELRIALRTLGNPERLLTTTWSVLANLVPAEPPSPWLVVDLGG